MKEELRPCIVKISEERESVFNSNKGCWTTEVVRKAETFNGYFHRWFERKESCDGYSLSDAYAVVECEDGSIRTVKAGCITFTDRCRKDVENHSSKCYDEHAMTFRFGEDNVLRIEFDTGVSRIYGVAADMFAGGDDGK